MKKLIRKTAGLILGAGLLLTQIFPTAGGFQAEAATGKWMKNEAGYYWYKLEDGTFPKNCWYRINGLWYHFDELGYMQTGWIHVSRKWYYLTGSGAMQTGWKKIGSAWYYFNESGTMHTGWKKVGGDWFFLDPDGRMHTGWKMAGGNWYYLNKSGAMCTGTVEINGTAFHFDQHGVWIEEEDEVLSDLSGAEIGDYVYFGKYEQDMVTSDGKEKIEWIVLDSVEDEEERKLLLLSRYALDCHSFDVTTGVEMWETSGIRNWLHEDFYNDAFSEIEQQKLILTANPAVSNEEYQLEAENDMGDLVFLLNKEEAEKYFEETNTGVSKARACAPTAYARARGAWTNPYYETDWYFGNCWWWLRDPGCATSNAIFVNYNGSIVESGLRNNRKNVAVRPAVWVRVKVK